MNNIKLSEIINVIEKQAHPSLQEDYDNSGLLVGSPSLEVNAVLICLDITTEVVEEAILNKCNLIISHHPVIFKGLKRLNGKNDVERIVQMVIKNDIAIYSAHTNLDNTWKGVNHILATTLGMVPERILRPMRSGLMKLVTYCPIDHADALRNALFSAGAGAIGNYNHCSFNSEGFGSFQANEGSNPFVGEIGQIHHEVEMRIETVFPAYQKKAVLKALKNKHPYEEVAYDVYLLDNEWEKAGSGMIALLKEPMDELSFMKLVKKTLGLAVIRHSPTTGKMIQRVAMCGGSGSFLIQDAIRSGADAFLTGDIKYHDFFLPERRLLLLDVGHYESEQFAKQLLYELLNKNFTNFALLISEVKTNAVNYF